MDNILKLETVTYLKSRVDLHEATLIMTPEKILLRANKANSLLNSFFRKEKEKAITVFELNYKKIDRVSQGRHGVQKNLLEITDKQNYTHRILVKNYHEWENAIKQQI